MIVKVWWSYSDSGPTPQIFMPGSTLARMTNELGKRTKAQTSKIQKQLAEDRHVHDKTIDIRHRWCYLLLRITKIIIPHTVLITPLCSKLSRVNYEEQIRPNRAKKRNPTIRNQDSSQTFKVPRARLIIDHHSPLSRYQNCNLPYPRIHQGITKPRLRQLTGISGLSRNSHKALHQTTYSWSNSRLSS